ncbi:hypothetical protein BKA93DRAFT_879375 [Sparassis latifolia]
MQIKRMELRHWQSVVQKRIGGGTTRKHSDDKMQGARTDVQDCDTKETTKGVDEKGNWAGMTKGERELLNKRLARRTETTQECFISIVTGPQRSRSVLPRPRAIMGPRIHESHSESRRTEIELQYIQNGTKFSLPQRQRYSTEPTLEPNFVSKERIRPLNTPRRWWGIHYTPTPILLCEDGVLTVYPRSLYRGN